MTKLQASRLLTLAWFLKTQVPKENFDMSLFFGDEIKPLGDCGTTACALGWCTVVFPGVFHERDGFVWPIDGVRSVGGSSYEVGEFFGISGVEGHHLFGQIQRTPDEEAAVIEKLVRKKGWVYA